MVGEIFVNLYVHPLNFSKIFSLITKLFINIHEYANEIIFIKDHWMKELIKLNH